MGDPLKYQTYPNPQPNTGNQKLVVGIFFGCAAVVFALFLFSMIAIAVLIQLGKNVTSVFSDIDAQQRRQQQQQQQY